jgi:PleD family two-component response regulator
MQHSMSMTTSPSVLVASPDGRQAQALSEALQDGGFRVNRAHDEREAIDHAQFRAADAIVVDSSIAPPGYALCGKLRGYGLATPIVLTIAGHLTRDQELEALRAGAWAVLGSPVDIEALVLRLAAFVQPKRELDRVSEERLVDSVSGLYNPSGLTRRSTELAELASRHGLALACAVFHPVPLVPNHFADDRVALTFRKHVRTSDAVGRTGHSEFVVFAPGTHSGSAARLVRRMVDTVERAFANVREGNPRMQLRAGYSAAPAEHTISPPALLAQARSALETNF